MAIFQKKFLTLFTLLAIFSFLSSACSTGSREKKPKNLILIVVDAMRADHLGLYNYHRNTTPNIDSLASNAIVCQNAYSQSNWTCPSMASFFTGTYPIVHKIYNSPEKIRNRFSVLPENLTTIPEALKTKNLYTAAITSCGWVSSNSNYDQGFDEFHLVDREDQLIIDEAIDFISRKKGEEFFLYLHLLDLHDYYFFKKDQFKFTKSSYNLSANMQQLLSKKPAEIYQYLSAIRKKEDLPSEDLDYLIDIYDSYLFYTDQLIGKLIKTLEDEKILDKSLIIITADHGEKFFEHNELLHGGNSLYNEVMHIPLIIHNKNLFSEQINISEPVESIDIYPTIMEIFEIGEIKIDNISQLQGDSILQRNKYRTIFMENSAQERMKIIKNDWSYIFHKKNNIRELFNLKEDPGEKNNLAEKKRIVAKKMHEFLLRKIEASYKLSKKIIPEDRTMNKEVEAVLKSLGYIK